MAASWEMGDCSRCGGEHVLTIQGMCRICRREEGLPTPPEHGASTARCKGCSRPMTWAEQRVQFGRLLKRGKTAEEAKSIGPRCQKCVTKYLREEEDVTR